MFTVVGYVTVVTKKMDVIDCSRKERVLFKPKA